MSDLNIRNIIPAAGKLGGSRTIPGLAGLAEAKEKLDRLQDENRPQEYEIRKIPRNLVHINEKHDYEMIDLEKLADSILHIGLQQPLVVRNDLERNDIILETGERRKRAIDLLIERYKDYADHDDPDYLLYCKNVKAYELGYPCRVIVGIKPDMTPEDQERAEAESELRLIMTNEMIRPADPAFRQKKIRRLEELYGVLYQGKKINVIDQLVKDTGLSRQQIKNYRSIDKLIPELREEFEKNNISLKEGSTYARLSEEDQKTIYHLIESGKKLSLDEVEQLKKSQLSSAEEIKRLQAEADQAEIRKAAALEQLRKDQEKAMAEKESEIARLTSELRESTGASDEELKQAVSGAVAEVDQAYQAKLQSLEKEAEKYRQELETTKREQEKIREERQAETADPAELKARIQYETSILSFLAAYDNLQKSYQSYKNHNGTGLPELSAILQSL